MRVGVFIGNLNPTSGGGFTFQTNLLEALLKSKTSHQFYIFYYGEKKYQSDLSVEFIKIPQKKTLFKRVINKFFKSKYFFLKTIIDKQIELMWFIIPAFISVKIPYIYTVWDLSHRVLPFFPEVSISGWTWEDRENHYKTILPKAAYVITGTEAGKNEIIKFYQFPDNRVRVVPFPTPSFALEYNNSDIINNKKLPDLYLFYPAQFWPHKNHIGLLHALKILKTKYGMDFSLVFTGSDKGNLKYIKERTEELGLNDRVYFFGFVTIEELVVLYKNAFAMVHPTFFGPDNFPPLEAFALGCPVIASIVSGAKEQLGDSALLIDPANEYEIAEAVMLLYQNSNLRQELINKGGTRAKQWTAFDYINGIINIIDEFNVYRRCWSNKEIYRGI